MRALHGLAGVTVVAGAAVLCAAPTANAACSVFSRVPCSPFVCSIYGGGFCISPVGQGVRLTIESAAAGDQPATGEAKDGKTADRDATDHELDTIRAMYDALRGCWVPPGQDEARPGTQMSVRFAFKRSGEIIAAPRVTYSTRDVPQQTRDTYRKAITASLDACVPLKFTGGLGGALAGRPIAIRYVDNRELGKP